MFYSGESEIAHMVICTSGRRRSRKLASLADLLRAEGSKSCERQQDPRNHGAADAPASDPAGNGCPPSKQEALAAVLYDLAIAGNLAAARLILAYCEGRPAQVQVNIAQHRPAKTYVVVSPDDWPAV